MKYLTHLLYLATLAVPANSVLAAPGSWFNSQAPIKWLGNVEVPRADADYLWNAAAGYCEVSNSGTKAVLRSGWEDVGWSSVVYPHFGYVDSARCIHLVGNCFAEITHSKNLPSVLGIPQKLYQKITSKGQEVAKQCGKKYREALRVHPGLQTKTTLDLLDSPAVIKQDTENLLSVRRAGIQRSESPCLDTKWLEENWDWERAKSYCSY